jgi:hypothetical protein
MSHRFRKKLKGHNVFNAIECKDEFQPNLVIADIMPVLANSTNESSILGKTTKRQDLEIVKYIKQGKKA